jgi:hypothetical protein
MDRVVPADLVVRHALVFGRVLLIEEGTANHILEWLESRVLHGLLSHRRVLRGGVSIHIAGFFVVLLLIFLLVTLLARLGRLVALARNQLGVVLVSRIAAFVLARVEQARAGLLRKGLPTCGLGASRGTLLRNGIGKELHRVLRVVRSLVLVGGLGLLAFLFHL